jgi:hypothetical protein
VRARRQHTKTSGNKASLLGFAVLLAILGHLWCELQRLLSVFLLQIELQLGKCTWE